jgi:hypothetical protein
MEKAFLAIGSVLLLIAFVLGLYSSTGYGGQIPTHTLAGASGGYAVAAGLCFIASALASRGRRGPD